MPSEPAPTALLLEPAAGPEPLVAEVSAVPAIARLGSQRALGGRFRGLEQQRAAGASPVPSAGFGPCHLVSQVCPSAMQK